jgi:hypothetical protein
MTTDHKPEEGGTTVAALAVELRRPETRVREEAFSLCLVHGAQRIIARDRDECLLSETPLTPFGVQAVRARLTDDMEISS